MILHGKDILILDSSSKAVIAAAKSCEINVNVDSQEVSSPTTGIWKAYDTQRKGWSVSLNHLVTSLTTPTLMVGDKLSIVCSVVGDIGISFDGFVNNSPVRPLPLTGTPDAIFWDTRFNLFVGRKGTDYYINWTNSGKYTSLTNEDQFRYNGNSYIWRNHVLALDRLAGNVIVKQARITATKGNLSQGSIQLLGNGPLAQPTLTGPEETAILLDRIDDVLVPTDADAMTVIGQI